MTTTNAALAQAIEYHQTGAYAQAEYLYRQIINAQPNDGETLGLLGLIRFQLGHPDEAVAYLRQAISCRPTEARFHEHLGLAYRAVGQLDEALASYQEALRLQPNAAGTHNNLGNLLRNQNKLDEAEKSFRESIRLEPRLAEAHNNLGALLLDRGKSEEAAACFWEALRNKPAYPQAQTNLGNALAEMGDLKAAAGRHREALLLDPNFADAHLNLGNVLQSQGEFDLALASYQRALQLRPDLAEAYISLGACLAAQARIDEAISWYGEALRLQPNHPAVHHNLGAALREKRLPKEAESRQRLALHLKPDYPAAYVHLGHALADQLRMDEALAAYEKALKLRSSAALRIHVATLLPPVYRSMADLTFWRDRVTAETQRLETEGVTLDLTHQLASAAFYLAHQGCNDRDIQRTVAELHTAPESAVRTRPAEAGKIRIGFVSRYLRDHTIGRLTRGLIANLARDKFDVTVLSVGNHTDAMAQWIKQRADHYAVLPHSLPVARRIVVEQQLDVLFYTDIGMDAVTYSLAFTRLAPVQCTTWGHPQTTGISTVDYFISSEALESDESDQHYTEKLIRLRTPCIYYYRPEPPKQFQHRGAFGLPEKGTLYACPQSLFKLHPEFDQILGEILRRDPHGMLVLIQGQHPYWEQTLRQRFSETVPDVLDRVHFVPYLEYRRFLNLNTLADVLLDPIHYGGGNTSFEGLALGVPIVTMPSKLLRGRITHCLYQQMGISDCTVSTPEEYVERAVRLGTDSDYRAAVSAKIMAANHVLFENSTGVRELEEFLEQAVARVP